MIDTIVIGLLLLTVVSSYVSSTWWWRCSYIFISFVVPCFSSICHTSLIVYLLVDGVTFVWSLCPCSLPSPSFYEAFMRKLVVFSFFVPLQHILLHISTKLTKDSLLSYSQFWYFNLLYFLIRLSLYFCHLVDCSRIYSFNSIII